ncbi:ORF 3 [Fragaria chiloensis latent virus]|uniref:ORF 3 n=1 Tax=Fragaria chiloensis latent virus TaxID=255238 RepID=Q5UKX2_9BROM|nr:ORF 3 [Fragaria chiloensis latent virus]AAV40825.1 ORF 3 [Fragaria chiloensis latent virus]
MCEQAHDGYPEVNPAVLRPRFFSVPRTVRRSRRLNPRLVDEANLPYFTGECVRCGYTPKSLIDQREWECSSCYMLYAA